jgi:hypothetical protein
MERERNERAMAPAKRGHWQCTSAAASRRATRTTSSARRTARRSSVARLTLRSGWGRCPWSLCQRRASSWRKAGRTTGRSSRARGSRRSRRAGGLRRRRRRADGGGAAALEGQPPVVGSESEDSDESALSDDERAARLGCKGRPRPTLCFLGSRSAGSSRVTRHTVYHKLLCVFFCLPGFLRPGFMQRRVLVQYAYCECYE